MTSYVQKKETVERKWYVIDAEGKPLGRVASKAAHILRGKHKATYTPNIDCGDFIIIINAEKAILTGNKLDNKKYYKFQYPQVPAKELYNVPFKEKRLYTIIAGNKKGIGKNELYTKRYEMIE